MLARRGWGRDHTSPACHTCKTAGRNLTSRLCRGPGGDGVCPAVFSASDNDASPYCELYERLWGKHLTAALRPAIERLPTGGWGLVVDCGAGTGRAGALLRSHTQIDGLIEIDLSHRFLAAPRHAASLRIVSDLQHMPLNTESVDSAIAAFALGRISHRSAVLSEAVRVLRRGGRLVIVDWGWSFPSRPGVSGMRPCARKDPQLRLQHRPLDCCSIPAKSKPCLPMWGCSVRSDITVIPSRKARTNMFPG